jgi:1,2-diacylglycerol 3-alpha-glucosyltransferase
MKPKYLLIWDRIGDYHRSRWRALAQITDQHAVFGADLGAADGLYKWENTSNLPGYYLLSEKPVEQPDFWGRIGRFLKLVRQQKINVVCIAGYGRKEYVAFIVLSVVLGKKVILFAESWYGGKSVLNSLKGAFLKAFCKGFIVSGQFAKTHFVNNLGIPANKIQIGYSVVDNAHFASASGTSKPQKPIILCVARFSPEKNLINLVQAFLQSGIRDSHTLKLVGGGPLKHELEALAAGHSNIEISSWLGYNQLPGLYASATWFILPSTFEPWGLVVNEAMAAGLPLILSEQCGCHPDLLDNSNGLLFYTQPSAEGQSLLATLNRLASITEEEMLAMGEASREKIKQFSPETWAQSIIQLAQ